MERKAYKHAWYIKNKKRLNNKMRIRYHATKTCPDRRPAMSEEERLRRQREFYYANRERRLAKANAHYQSMTVEERVEHNRKRRERHKRQPEVRNRIERIRDHNKRANGSLSLSVWQEVCRRYADICIYCGSGENITIEHLLPVSRGGDNSADNLAPACLSCNSSKRNKTYDEFIEWRNR